MIAKLLNKAIKGNNREIRLESIMHRVFVLPRILRVSVIHLQ